MMDNGDKKYIWELNEDIRYFKGVGEQRCRLLNKLDICCLKDLLQYYPFRYEDRSKIVSLNYITPGEMITVKARVFEHASIRTRMRWKNILKIIVTDDEGYLSLVCYNRNYLKTIMKKGDWFFISGKVEYKYGELQMSSFDFERIEDSSSSNIHTGRLVPVYSATEGIKVQFIRALIYNQLTGHLKNIKEYLPRDIINKYHLMSYERALYCIHFPKDENNAEAARQRLAFDRFFILELLLASRKNSFTVNRREKKYTELKLKNDFVRNLPFKLTNAQISVIKEIKSDLGSNRIMHRLLQGDVGSGKTIVALISMLIAVGNGFQALLMSPSTILAKQHFLKISEYLKDLDIHVVLLTGNQASSERKTILEEIENGTANIIIGTHAIIQDDVEFKEVGIAVIDEQHRFGVMQRAKIVNKGNDPDLLVMTATPIPRTLSLTLYGDLDVSVIDELPPGRKPITTKWFGYTQRKKLYSYIKDRIKEGNKAFFIYPLIEESEKLELKAAEEMYKEFRDIYFKDINVALIHSKIKDKEKDEIMTNFRDNNIDLLVSTTVVEVGVDIPDATLMVIEHAERFGLAQLHQLRGRIGRGSKKSYCILITGKQLTKEAQARMKIMCKNSDGFKLAEEDLKLRGPGEIMGTKQSGMPDLKPANIIHDTKILNAARKEAFDFIDNDPAMDSKEAVIFKQMIKAEKGFDVIRSG